MHGLVTEDHNVDSEGLITTSGKIDVIDPDHGEGSVKVEKIHGQFGTLKINSDGQWQYQVDNTQSNIQALTQKAELHESFTIHTKDGTPQVLNMTIGGENDNAVIAGVDAGTVTEESQLQTSGTLTVTDVDAGEAHFSNTDIVGTLGTLHLKDNGTWTYDLDNTNPTVQALGKGATAIDTITITSADGTTHQVTITVNGTNDKAVIAGTDTGAVTEESQLQTSGKLSITDVDTGEAHFSITDIVGTLGTLHLKGNGAWTYDLDNTNQTVQALGKSATATDTFTVTSADGTTHHVTITVNGTNDAATVSSATVTVDETDTAVTTSGTLTSTDVDNPDNAFTPDSITGTNGDLTIDANGHWTFTANSAFNQINVGDKVEETFTVTSVDGTPSTIKVTVNGTNDAATVSSATVAVDETDSAITTSGTLTSTDVDNPDNVFTPDSITGTNGDLTIDANGHWTFTANSAFNQLNVGDKVEETFTVNSVDGTPSTIKVTINGTNDAATVSSATVAVDETDSAVTTSGTLTSTDVDNPDNAFTASTLHGTNGDLTIDANGHWTFTANSAFNQLNVGDKVEETFTVTSVDGTPSTIKVTINGTNDAATVSSATVAVNETDTAVTTSGTLTSTDVDNPDNAFTASTQHGTNGDLTIDANGQWTFTANSAFNQLNVGVKVEETFTVTSVDGTPSTVKVTINGTNDRPTISGVSTGNIIEQGSSTPGTADATGTLTASDLDTADTVKWAVTQPQGQMGTLSIDQQGHWHYRLDNTIGSATDKLAAGEHQSESFWVTATDSAGATVPHKIVIDVQGSNDNPVVSGWTQLPAGKEDQPVTIKASDLLAHTSDVDTTDILHVSNLQATHGSLTDNKDGTYTFTPDKDFNGEIKLTYDVVDGHGGSVSTQAKFDLTAAPDNAIITDAQTNADLRGVTEDRGYIDTHYQIHYEGKLNIQDPDAGEAQFDPNIGPQTYQGIGYDTKLGGHVVLMRDGHYTYTIDNRNIQNLAQGEVKHDSAVIRSVDGTTHTIELTVHGTNDAPTINAQSHSVMEGGSVLQGQMVGQDIDTGASLTYSAPQVDGLVVNPDGSYSFNPSHSAYQSLASGVAKTLTIPITVTDEHNVSSTQNLSITVTGVNNSAVIGGVDTGGVTEGNAGQNMSPDYAQPGMAKLGQAALSATGKLDISDQDSGESQFDPKGGAWNNSYHGQYGHLLLNTDGTWHYHVTVGSVDWVGNRKTTVGTTIDQLGENQTLTDTITVYSKDGTSHDIVITIHGSNDKPYCASEVQLNSGREDSAQTITTTELLANTVDVDANDTGKLVIANLHADHGSIRDNHDGTYTFTPDKDYNGQVHFTYDVKDAHSGVTHTGARMTLAPVGDAAIIAGTDTGSITEDKHVLPDSMHRIQVVGSLSVSDPDAGEDHFRASGAFGHERAISDPFQGEMHIDRYGNWDYVLANGNPAVQALKQGETKDVIYEVHSADGTSHLITITVTGTNDAPTVSSSVTLAAGREDSGVTLQASDLLANASDIDHDAQLSIHNLSADHGKVTDNHDGTFRFTPDKDYTGPVQFSYQIQDEHGASVQQTASMNLAPQDDAAVIGGKDTGDVTEDHNLASSVSGLAGQLDTYGTLTVTDPDAGQSEFDAKLLANAYHTQLGGRLYINDRGDWGYSVDNSKPAIQQLGQNETLTDTITVHSKDGTTHDIVITIHGTNDAPTISSEVQLNSGKEDIAQTITAADLLANAIDVDHNDQGQLSIANLMADYGSIKDNHDGTYTFTPDKDYNGQVHFTYDVKDAHSGVTHTGANMILTPTGDAARFSGTDTGALTEDHHVQGDAQHTVFTTGVLDVIDPDSGEDQFRATRNAHALHDPYGGTLTIGKAGDWSYSVPNGNVQHLGKGETHQVSYEVQSAGGDKHTITLTIHGTNDAPTVSADVQLNPGKEDATQVITQAELLANATDIDSNDRGQLSISQLTVDHGSVLDNGDGTYTLLPETDYSGPLHFHYQVNDAHGGSTPASAAMTVDSVNDRPDVQSIDERLKEDSSNHHAVDLLTGATDKEGDALSVSQISYSVDGAAKTNHLPDGFTLGTDGHSIVVDATHSAFQHLSVGQTQQVVVSYLVDDGHGGQTPQTATFTIEGTDDKAVLTSNVIQMTESEALKSKTSVYQGNLQLTDPDTGDHTQFAFSGRYMGQGYAPGSLYIWPDGSYKFTMEYATNRHADDLVDSLHQGESLEFPYQIRTSDGQRLNIIVKVTGEDDNARITVGQYSSLANHAYEDNLAPGSTPNQVWSGGNLHVIDPDHGQAGFVAQSFDTQEGGHFSINVRGVWQYTIDNSKLQHLGEGQSYQKTFTVESIDGTAQQVITVTVHGTNDDPVVTASITLPQGTEDTPVVLQASDLLANATDIDDNSHLSVHNLTADHGMVVDNHDGTFSFTPEQNYNGRVVFHYDVTDEHGGHVQTNASMTLAPVDDKAVFSGQDTGNVTEDQQVQGNSQQTIFTTGVLDVTDPDSGQDHFHATLNAHALHDNFGGSLSIRQAGDWTYSVPNANVQHLSQGETAQVEYEVQSASGEKHSIVITIHGTNDTPTITSQTSTPSVDEDSGLTASGSVLISDVDHSDHLSVAIDAQHQPKFGQVVFDDKTGTWQYQVNDNNPTVDALNDGDTLTDKFRITVDDGHGGTASKEVQVVINGHTDRPITPTLVVSPQITGGAGHQDLHASLGTPPQQTSGSQHSGWGIMGAAGHVVTSLHGQFGTLHVDPNTGHLDYDYGASSGVIKTHTGGSYGAGTDETDTFILTVGGAQNSQVAVHLHLHSQSVHGHSGHHIDLTTLTGIDVSPLAPPPPPPPVMSQADEPMDEESLEADVMLTSDDVTNDEEQGTKQDNFANTEDTQHGAAAYLSALGIEPVKAASDMPGQVALPDDIDLVLADDTDSIDTSFVGADELESALQHDDDKGDKHTDLINPDEHHDQDDPSSFIDPY
ncbi:hypothetical protein GCM10025776_09310 [Corallincola platygyrae]